MVVVLGICFVLTVWKSFYMITKQEDRIDELCERLDKLERDALKITFEKEDERKQK
jgi:hypothetical protein